MPKTWRPVFNYLDLCCRDTKADIIPEVLASFTVELAILSCNSGEGVGIPLFGRAVDAFQILFNGDFEGWGAIGAQFEIHTDGVAARPILDLQFGSRDADDAVSKRGLGRGFAGGFEDVAEARATGKIDLLFDGAAGGEIFDFRAI